MTTVELNMDASAQQWGLVVVLNADRTVNRRFKITKAEHDAVAGSSSGMPPGVSEEEWTSGRAILCGKDFVVGNMRRNEDGSVIAKIAETITENDVQECYVVFQQNEVSGTPPNITVDAIALANAVLLNSLAVEPMVVAVADGVVTLG